jgi:hypothetical protein
MRDKHFSCFVLLCLALMPATAQMQALPDNPEPAARPSAGFYKRGCQEKTLFLFR